VAAGGAGVLARPGRAEAHPAEKARLDAFAVPVRFELLAPHKAGTQYPATDSYSYGIDGLTASTVRVEDVVDARVLSCVWQVVWRPMAPGCGCRLRYFDPRVVNEVTIHEFTGIDTTNPITSSFDFTPTMQRLIDIPTQQFKYIGFQVKGDGAVGPLLWAVWVHMVLGVK
jgi:hypothetical protein